VDEACVIVSGQPLPLEDGAVDVVVSDFTFEHVADATWLGRELTRVVRPGGWVCARTPNKHGYIALGARIVPNRLHGQALRRLQPTKAAIDTFPTRYRLNSSKDIGRAFPDESWDRTVWTSDSEPAYVGRSNALLLGFRTLSQLTPPPLRSMLSVFLRRRDPGRSEVP
jgi:SAM-dependent methyltransferase